MTRFFALALTLALLTGCDTAAPDLGDPDGLSLRLGGAVDADFAGAAVESRAEAKIVTLPDGTQEFRLLLAAADRTDDADQTGEEIVKVEVVHRFGGAVAPGTYHVADIEHQHGQTQAGLSYQFESDNLSARYTARGRNMVLEIVRVDDAYVSGRLQVQSSEVSGQRRLYGQAEEITLAGRIDASATFEARLVE